LVARYSLEGNAMVLESSVKKSAVMKERTAAGREGYRTLLHVVER